MDRLWWLEYGDKLAPGPELWTSNREAFDIFKLHYVAAAPGIDAPCGNLIFTGGNSGFQALSLALLWGAARVVLLGFDMKHNGRTAHWHHDHVELGNPTKKDLGNWCGNFAVLASQVAAPIINASRETALTCFPRMPLAQSLGLTSVTRSRNVKKRSSTASRKRATRSAPASLAE